MSKSTGAPLTLPNVIQHDVTNLQTGRNYRIQISWPLKWDRTKQLRDSKIPVIYILDGNSLFLTATEILWRSSINSFYQGGGIVVGIGYKDVPTESGSLYSSQRNTDLTLSEHEVHAGLGGADAFLKFITEEVKPLVRKQFPDVSIGKEAIFGHSFGGLCVLHALFSEVVFDAYFAASPSIWWDSKIVAEAEDFCSGEAARSECSLQLSYGSLEARPTQYPSESEIEFEERERVSAERKMGENAVVMEKLLRQSGRFRDLSIIEFADDDHCTVVTPALLRAMICRFCFNLTTKDRQTPGLKMQNRGEPILSRLSMETSDLPKELCILAAVRDRLPHQGKLDDAVAINDYSLVEGTTSEIV